MSVTGLSSSDPPSKLFHKPIHHRNDSDELDVFEAAKYFSGYNEGIPHYYATTKSRASLARAPSGVRRMSLDMPMADMSNHQKQILNEKICNGKSHKQPSSPGGKLVSFLNTLFHQAAGGSKKKPPKSAAAEEDKSPFGGGARTKRRSSIRQFTRSFADTKSWYSTTSSKSGFRTPPPVCTPTKAGFRTVVCGQNQKPVCNSRDSSWLDEKLSKLSNDGLLLSGSNEKSTGSGGDDGGESDSSSDLFELQNYDLDAYSSGLPVYETIDVGSIRSGTSTI